MNDLEKRLQAALGQGYRLERELGGGGMSRVFLAQEVELGRKVVVKVLPPDMAAGLNAERFRREIQLAASLQHPHIVPLIAAGRSGELVWYTMPFIEGESLRTRLAREGELPISDAVRILRDVTDALAYAHTHGVVHRDIKPDNVLMSGRHAVVMDFGVAKAVSASTGEASLTSIGVALGTPAYMAPEQAAADPHVDHRADIYATGALGYELLTGHPPFEGTPQAVLAAHVTQVPDPVNARRATVPPALAALIMRCLEKKAADRWQSAADVHQQLELMATPSGGATPTTATAAARPKKAKPSLWIVAFAGAGFVLVGIAAVLLFNRNGSGSETTRLDPNVVAVLPFRVAGADPSLHYLRQGMVDLLQAKLTGEGGPRAADARSVLAAFRDAGGTDIDDVARDGMTRIADRVGAGRILQGSIVGPPGHVVISAELVGMPATEPLAQTTVEGPKDSLFAMVDRLATQLLALGAGASAQQLSALTTTNPEALRAYLDGVVAYRRGAFEVVTTRLTRAAQLDSTFALALSALIEANGWVPTTGLNISQVRRLAWQYRDRLSPRDQLLLSNRLGSQYPKNTPWHVRIADRQRAPQLAPESPEAWYLWADALFHYGHLADFRDPHAEARRGFEQAFRLDSLFGAPISHLSTLAFLRNDSTEVRRWAERFAVLDTTSGVARGLAWERIASSRNPRAITAFLARLDSTGRGAVAIPFFYPLDSVTVAHLEDLMAMARKQATSPDDRLNVLQGLRVIEMDRGRPSEARSWLDSARAVNPEATAFGGMTGVVSALVRGEDTLGVETAISRLPRPVQERVVAVLELVRGRPDSA
ncbi:MAG: serine/threonine-protein kinase, partial [Gemmatimonadales bacterium]